MDNRSSQTDAARIAFIRAGSPAPGNRILDLGWEGECQNEALAMLGCQARFVADDIRAVRRCRHGQSTQADRLAALGESAFDLVLYKPAQRAAKEQVFSWIDESFAALNAGGRLCLAGRRDRGVESYASRVAAVFGHIEKVQQVGKVRVYRAIKNTPVPQVPPVSVDYAFQSDDLPGGPYSFCAQAGVFSRDGIDVGSRLLIEQVALRPDARVLDLGCGYGLLGIVCARLANRGQVRMGDVSFRAVQCARKNLAVNRIENARADVADGYEGLEDAQFDLIVSNPPFHEGNAVGHPFIEGAATHLSPEGRLMMVVMRFEPYLRRMRHVFHRAEIVARRSGYAVLCASKK